MIMMTLDEKTQDGPDGEPPPTTTTTTSSDEKKPMNNGDLEVSTVRPIRRRCCDDVTRTQRFLAVLLIVAFLMLLAVITAAVLGIIPYRCLNSPSALNSAAEGEDSGRPVTPKPDLSHLRWSAIRLPRIVIPTFYSVKLRIDLERFTFIGSSVIDLRVDKDTDLIVLHVSALAINPIDVYLSRGTSDETTRAEVEGAVSGGSATKDRNEVWGRQERFRKVTAAPINDLYLLEMNEPIIAGQICRIHFSNFSGLLTDDLRGLYRSTYRDKNGNTRYLAASQLQSIDARRVFPCFDEPDLKARFAITLIHKREYTALSNTPVVSSSRLDDDWQQDEYDITPIMSTYLLAFVVADFRHRETVTASGLKIRIWSQPDTFDQTAYALEFAGSVYEFFARYFDTHEVVEKADHVAIPDFSAGAMENWGLVLYRETTLLYDESVSSIASKYWVSLVVAHEIAHTWFGNMVTMAWWDDLWLNEGFANTLMYFALDSIYGTWKVYDLQLVNNVYPVMTKDSLLASHPISTPIVHPDDITSFFDSISYDKGMAVLRLLRGFLGWDNFQKGLQLYVKNYKFKNAKMSQLWQTFEEASQSTYKIGDIMDTWTRQMGFPVVTISHVTGNRYKLNQKRFLINPDDIYDQESSPYRYKWKIPFLYKFQGQDEVLTEWMDMGSAEITIPNNSWIIGNVDYMGFYRTNYDTKMWEALIQQLRVDHKVISAANRAGLINDAFNLARAGLLSYEIAFNLTSYLHKETDYLPWRAFLDSIDFIKGMMGSSDSFGTLQRYVYDLVEPHYKRIAMSDQGTLLERNIRRELLEAATSVGMPAAIEWARNKFDLWKNNNTKIPPDYAGTVYAVGIQQGGEEEWDYVWNKSVSTRVASEAEVMMTALAYTQHQWLLWRYARFSMDSTKIRMQDVRNLFRYFTSTMLGRSVALQFLLTYWNDINEKFGVDIFLMRDIIHATTSFINTSYELRQLERLFKESPPASNAARTAENSLALVRSNVKWMKSNHDTIHRWLTTQVHPHK